MSRELLTEVVEMMRSNGVDWTPSKYADLLTRIEAELAKPEPEPVAWLYKWADGSIQNVYTDRVTVHITGLRETPLYAAPPAREPLSEDEILKIGLRAGFAIDVAEDVNTGEEKEGFLDEDGNVDSEPFFEFAHAIEAAVRVGRSAGEQGAVKQPILDVQVLSFPESNGKRNWTALLVRKEKWDGLVGTYGGIGLLRSEYWNRVAYEAERAKFLIGLRDTEPHILDYGDDIATPDEWAGETRTAARPLHKVQQEEKV